MHSNPLDYDFDAGKLKRSYGIAAQWLAPMGLFRFSYAIPVNSREGTDRFYSDETERFQFTVGGAF